MEIRRYITVSLVALILFLLLLTLIKTGILKSGKDFDLRRMQTLSLAQQIFVSLSVLTAQDEKDLQTLLAKQKHVGLLTLLKKHHRDNHRIQNLDRLMDGWGRDFIVVSLDEAKASNVLPKLVYASRIFVIWSAGANGTNEFGNGDDVYYVPPEVEGDEH